MGEEPESSPKQMTFGEAVKVVKSKPERGSERSDLLVRDDILQPHWHWSRIIGVPREDAIERSRKIFFEEVMLVGDEKKLKEKKPKK